MKMTNRLLSFIPVILAGILVISMSSLQAQTLSHQAANPPPESGLSSNVLPLIDFRVLKSLLPETVAALKRTQASGEKSGAMGMVSSFAEGSYEGSKDELIAIKISDLGGMPPFMVLAQMTWADMDIDRETDTDYERTFFYKTFKGHEQYNKELRSGDLEMLIGKRFRLEISGQNIDSALLRKIMESLDLKKLNDLNPEAQETSSTNAGPVVTHAPLNTVSPSVQTLKPAEPVPAAAMTNQGVVRPSAVSTNAP